MEESNFRQRFWRPQLCHLTNRPYALQAPKYYSIFKRKSPLGDLFFPLRSLFFCLLESNVLSKSFAELLELDLSLDFLLVLAGPVCFACLLVLKLYKLNL